MGNFYTDVIKKDPRFHSIEICKDLALLEPEFLAKVLKFKAFAEIEGHVVEVIETYRSPARQLHLYNQHLTQLRNVCVHGYGLAIDFGLFINGKYDPKGADYLSFVALAKEAGVISGVNWGHACPHASGFKDFDHIQGVPILRQGALFAGTWYPPAGYNPWTDQAAHGVA